jgi:cyclic pyranopterin phosphate synthase
MTMDRPFSHINAEGKLRMVDVSQKRPTRRQAQASCLVLTVADVDALEPRADGLDPWHAARVAGVLAAKRTAELIPLCHSLNLNDVDVELVAHAGRVEISATVTATQRTGVEMEALSACAFAALSIVGALKSTDPLARIDDLVLLRKEGGRSGSWGREVRSTESE